METRTDLHTHTHRHAHMASQRTKQLGVLLEAKCKYNPVAKAENVRTTHQARPAQRGRARGICSCVTESIFTKRPVLVLNRIQPHCMKRRGIVEMHELFTSEHSKPEKGDGTDFIDGALCKQ